MLLALYFFWNISQNYLSFMTLAFSEYRAIFLQNIQQWWGKSLTDVCLEKSCCVAFADFHGVNAPIMADVKLPTWCCWMCHWKELCTVSSHMHEPAHPWMSLSLGLELVFSRIEQVMHFCQEYQGSKNYILLMSGGMWCRYNLPVLTYLRVRKNFVSISVYLCVCTHIHTHACVYAYIHIM